MGAAMRAIVANPNDAAASATISRDPRYRSMLRTTCVATMLTGGHAQKRAAADGDRERQLPHGAGTRSGRRARAVS